MTETTENLRHAWLYKRELAQKYTDLLAQTDPEDFEPGFYQACVQRVQDLEAARDTAYAKYVAAEDEDAD